MLFCLFKYIVYVYIVYTGNGRGEAGEAERFDEGQDDEQPTHELDVEEEPVCTFARTPKKRRGSPAPARKFSL